MNAFLIVGLVLFALVETLHFLWKGLDLRATASRFTSLSSEQARAAGTLIRTCQPTPTAVTLADGRRFEFGEGLIERKHGFRPRRYFRRETIPRDGYAFRFSYSPYPMGGADVYTTFDLSSKRHGPRYARMGGTLVGRVSDTEDSITLYFVDERGGTHYEIVYR